MASPKSAIKKWTLAEARARVKSLESPASTSREIDEAFRRRMMSGEWLSSGSPGNVGATPIEFDPGAWNHFALWLAAENMLVQPTGNKTKVVFYLVKVWPANSAKRRGRATELPWVTTWCKSNHPAGLPKKLSDILPGLSRDFKAEQRNRRLLGQRPGSLTDEKATEHLRILKKWGYDASGN